VKGGNGDIAESRETKEPGKNHHPKGNPNSPLSGDPVGGKVMTVEWKANEETGPQSLNSKEVKITQPVPERKNINLFKTKRQCPPLPYGKKCQEKKGKRYVIGAKTTHRKAYQKTRRQSQCFKPRREEPMGQAKPNSGAQGAEKSG